MGLALRTVALAVAVLLALIFIPTRWIMRAPGTAEPVAPMIHVKGHQTWPALGRLYLTTVLVEPANALLCLYAMLDPEAELVEADAPEAPPPPLGDSRLQTQLQQSQYLAKVAALRQLGYRIDSEPLGGEILGLVSGSPAAGTLESSDVVVRAGGREIRRAEDLKAVLSALPGGAPVEMTVRRGGKPVHLSVPTLVRDGHAWMGVSVRTRVEQAPLPFPIDIEAGNIDGASAGLMFSLAIYNLLTPPDETMALLVAGTGTIDADGVVGPIQGADMKVKAAERVGAQYFLCPEENAGEARSAATALEVVPVASLSEALAKLKELGGGGKP